MGIKCARDGIVAGRVLMQVKWESSIKLQLIEGLLRVVGKASSGPSSSSLSCLPSWSTEDFLEAHRKIKNSGKYNYQECRIPIPTSIRYDRIEAALGKDVYAEEARVLSLLKYGMPINCKPSFGVRKIQKKHFSALSFNPLKHLGTNSSPLLMRVL